MEKPKIEDFIGKPAIEWENAMKDYTYKRDEPLRKLYREAARNVSKEEFWESKKEISMDTKKYSSFIIKIKNYIHKLNSSITINSGLVKTIIICISIVVCVVIVSYTYYESNRYEIKIINDFPNGSKEVMIDKSTRDVYIFDESTKCFRR